MRTDSRFPRLHIVDHPLIEHKLSLMRDKNTGTQDFRTLLHEIALLMGYEVTRDFPTKLEDIETPICATKSPMLVEKDPVIVPVLRAGLGMTDGLLALLPAARVGHIGVYRNAQHEPVDGGRRFAAVDAHAHGHADEDEHHAYFFDHERCSYPEGRPAAAVADTLDADGARARGSRQPGGCGGAHDLGLRRAELYATRMHGSITGKPMCYRYR